MKKEDYSLPKSLDNEETIKLIREYKKTNSVALKNKIIEGNLRSLYLYVSAHSKNIVGSESQCYPSINDLVQEAVFTLCRVIDKFDPEQNIKFSTYLSAALFNMLGMQARKNPVKADSLDKPVGEDETLTMKDILVDSRSVPTEVLIENMDFLKDVLCCLQYQYRKVYIDKVFRDMNQYDIAKKYNISQATVSNMLSKTFEKIKYYREKGITDLDVEIGGVNLSSFAYKTFKECHQIVKKYGIDLLRDGYLPSLSPQNAALFEESVLYYAGQNFSEFCSRFGQKNSQIQDRRYKIISNLDENIEKIKQQIADGKISLRPIPANLRQRISNTQQLVKNHGGRIFLTRYFIPQLQEDEKLSFKYGVLNYGGQNLQELSKKTNLPAKELSHSMDTAIKKLKTTNFFENIK